MGHEAAGVVHAIGSDVKGLKVGDNVVIYSWLNLDETRNYSAAIGCGVYEGAFATHVVVPEEKYCVKIETNVPVEQAALLACSGVTGYKALKRVKEILAPERKSRFLVIIGAGGVGLQAIRLSKIVTGVAPIVCDVDDKKLNIAKQIGPQGTIIVNTSDGKALDTIKSLTQSTGGPDAIIDFVGLKETIQFGIGLLSLKSHPGINGKYVGVGLFGGSVEIPLFVLIARMITIEGSFTGSLEDMRELLKIVADNNLNPIPIIKKELRVESVNEGLAALKKGVEGRVVMCSKL
jgi:D-arabinose 1-dehydrogenase-like Zn-dependent alcohol dehydrogenase